MNNEGFKKMVRSRGGSSTKEIARAAVEEEFKKHRKRKNRAQDDYLSDSDEEGGRKTKKKEVLFRPPQLKMLPESVEDKKYRDRAKERREGGMPGNLSRSGDDSNVADFRGYMKGLDLSMLREEKAQLKGHSDLGVSSVKDKLANKDFPSFETAQAALEKFVANPDDSVRTELSEFVVRFVSSKFSIQVPAKKVSNGVAGRTLQRTRLVLRPHTHILDRSRAWEAPREIVQATTPVHRTAPHLTETVLAYVRRLFPDGPSKAKNFASTIVTGPMSGSATAIQQDSQQHSHGWPQDETTAPDDDDIFAGLDDYVPPSAS